MGDQPECKGGSTSVSWHIRTWRDVRVVLISEGRRQEFKLVLAGGTQFLECRAFQTAEVAFAGRCLLKDMLCYFKRRDRFTC